MSERDNRTDKNREQPMGEPPSIPGQFRESPGQSAVLRVKLNRLADLAAHRKALGWEPRDPKPSPKKRRNKPQ